MRRGFPQFPFGIGPHVARAARPTAGTVVAIPILAASLLFLFGASAFGQTLELRSGTTVRFATVEEGSKALHVQDEFVDRLSPFDRSARTKTEGEVSTSAYLDFVGSQVKAWTDAEQQTLRDFLTSAKPKLEWMSVPLPAEILFVKTSNDDEGGNPYTRGAAIVLPERVLQGADAKLDHVVLHELFHVLSRHNPSLRAKLYAIVGFEMCNEIALPDSLAPRRVTNPDAPRMDVMIEVEHQGKRVRTTPVLVSKVEKFSRADIRPFPMGYLDFMFAELEEKSGKWSIRSADGAAVLLDPMSIKGFFEKVGRNTPYIIHPEEILADNFVIAVTEPANVPTPRVVKELKAALSKNP